MRWVLMFVIACGGSTNPSVPSPDAPIQLVDAPQSPDAGLSITDGVLDQTFGTNGIATLDLGGSERGGKITRESSGRLVVFGDGMLIGFTPAGALDTAFGTAGKIAITDPNSDLSDVVGANGGLYLLSDVFGAERHTATGEIDTAYGTEGESTTTGGAISAQVHSGHGAVDASGRVISTFLDGSSHVRVMRFVTNGIEDPLFTRLDLGSGFHALAVAVQADHQILVGRFPDGESTAIVRLADDGTVDTTYNPPVATNTNIPSRGVVATPDGHAWLAGFGTTDGYYIDHLTSGGAETAGFPVSFSGADIVEIAALPDGRMIGVGVMPGSVGFAIAMSADGLHATRWTIGGSLFGVYVGDDGAVYVTGGSANLGDPSEDILVAKLAT